ncbi:MFS transporter, partial [bacterium]|nr:MFS transporter [bacterium]
LRPALYTGIRFFTNDNTQTRAVSLLRMAFNLGFIIGPAIGGVIIALTSYKWIFILDAFTCWGAAIMTYFLIKDYSHKQFENKEEEIDKPIEVKNPYRDKPYLLFLFYSMLMLIGFFQILFTVPLYLEEIAHFSTDQIGFFFGINGALVFILEMPLVQYVDKRKIIMKAMVAGSVMIGFGLLALISQSYILLSLAVFLLLSGVGEIVNFPFISTTALKRATDQNSGKMLAMTSVMFSISLIIAPPLGTMILEEYAHVGHGAIIHGAHLMANCMIGMNSVIMDRAVVGEGSIVGAMTFVPADMEIPNRKIAIGNPAKIIKDVTDKMLEWKTKGTQLYQTLPRDMHEYLEETKALTEIPKDRPNQEKLFEVWNDIKGK